MTLSVGKIGQQNGRKLLRFLAKQRESLSPLLILAHDYPDPDALASALALQYLTEKYYGIQSRIAYGGIIGRMENKSMVQILKMPVYKLKPADLKHYDNVALVDTQPGFKNNSLPPNRKPVLIIDQHTFATKPAADLAIIDTECGATCVILAQALLILGKEIPARIATALAYGILSDTLHLYRANRARKDIVETYLSVLQHSDMRALARIQNPQRSRSFFVTLRKSIEEAIVRRGLIASHLGDIESPDLTSQVADFLLNYKGRHWSFCTGRYKGKLHVSLRTNNPNVEAGEVLQDTFIHRGEAGGWGGIAGGSIEIGKAANETVWQETEQSLTERLFKRLRIPLKGEPYFPFRQKTVYQEERA